MDEIQKACLVCEELTEEGNDLCEECEAAGVEVEVLQAYYELMGKQNYNAEDAAEKYVGKYEDSKDFARQFAEEIGALDAELKWPHNCIDWEQAAYELMMDYDEQDGHFFRY